jgi:hypothetical protein
MTTGRINQVTIVRRGWPLAGPKARRREFQVTGRRPLGARPRGCPGSVPWAPVAASAFPLFVPQSSLSPRRPPWGSAARAPQEEDSPPCLCCYSVVTAWLPPVAQCNSGQRPVIHRAHPSAAAGFDPRGAGHPQYAEPPGRPTSWGQRLALCSSVARPGPASQWGGTRNGRL